MKKGVVVLPCEEYDLKNLEKKIEESFKLLNFEIKNKSKVLLKPNLVMLSSEKEKQIAVTTNIVLIEAVCKILKEKECKIFIGESSFMSTPQMFSSLGIDNLAKKYGAKIVVFEKEELITIKDKNAKVLKEFPVASILKEVDYIINMPKMKTHLLAHVTLAVKNLYGLIPGGLKQKLHLKARGDKFSEILVDIYQNFPPHLNILDGIIGMEGHGPAAGLPKKAGLILVSENAVALDIAASRIMGFKPKKIPSIKKAIKRGLYPNYEFELLGIDKLPLIPFKKAGVRKKIPKNIISIFKQRPIVCDINKCVRCGICAKHCPGEAIKLNPFPEVDKKKCIRCFCCMEICPRHALSLKE